MAVAVAAFLAQLEDGTPVLVHEGDELPDDHELVTRETAGVLFARPAAPASPRRAKPARK